MNKLPCARSANIVVQPLGKEVLVYDLNNHKAYNLNETSAAIYQACDGATSFDDLKRRYRFTDDLIFLALDQLQADNLLEADYKASALAGMSRREALRKVGLASLVALPVVTALVAPTAASAQSNVRCLEGQSFCTTTEDCRNNISCTDDSRTLFCVCTNNCCVQCPEGTISCNGACIVPNTTTNCGRCGTVCAAGFVCNPATLTCTRPPA